MVELRAELAVARRFEGRGQAPRPLQAPAPPLGRLPALDTRPGPALRQQPRRTDHPHGGTQDQGLRLPPHPARSPRLRDDPNLPRHRPPPRPENPRRPHHRHARQPLDTRHTLTPGPASHPEINDAQDLSSYSDSKGMCWVGDGTPCTVPGVGFPIPARRTGRARWPSIRLST